MLRGLLVVGLLSVLCHGQASNEVSVEELGVGNPEPATDRELVSIRTAPENRTVSEAMTEIMGQFVLRRQFCSFLFFTLGASDVFNVS